MTTRGVVRQLVLLFPGPRSYRLGGAAELPRTSLEGDGALSGTTFEKQLLRGSGAPRTARGLVNQWFGESLDSDQLSDAKLLTSELVSNALMHGEGDVILRAEFDDSRLRIEVIDEGGGFEHEVREVGFDEVTGRGLAIVDAVSSRWGIAEGTTHVWFELERPGPRLGPRELDPGLGGGETAFG